MKTKFVVLLGLAIALSGCTFKARLYPVQGPLASKSPLPTYPVKMSGWIKSGTVVATLDGGEVCSGRIAFLAGKEEAAYQTSASEPALKDLGGGLGPGLRTWVLYRAGAGRNSFCAGQLQERPRDSDKLPGAAAGEDG